MSKTWVKKRERERERERERVETDEQTDKQKEGKRKRPTDRRTEFISDLPQAWDERKSNFWNRISIKHALHLLQKRKKKKKKKKRIALGSFCFLSAFISLMQIWWINEIRERRKSDHATSRPAAPSYFSEMTCNPDWK